MERTMPTPISSHFLAQIWKLCPFVPPASSALLREGMCSLGSLGEGLLVWLPPCHFQPTCHPQQPEASFLTTPLPRTLPWSPTLSPTTFSLPWSPRRSLSMLLPQDLCMCCPLCLECSTPDVFTAHPFEVSSVTSSTRPFLSTIFKVTALDLQFAVVLISLPCFICMPKNLQFSSVFYIFGDLSFALECISLRAGVLFVLFTRINPGIRHCLAHGRY